MRSTSGRSHVRRQVAHEVHPRVQKLESDEALEPVHQLLQIHGDEHAQQHAADDAEQCR